MNSIQEVTLEEVEIPVKGIVLVRRPEAVNRLERLVSKAFGMVVVVEDQALAYQYRCCWLAHLCLLWLVLVGEEDDSSVIQLCWHDKVLVEELALQVAALPL